MNSSCPPTDFRQQCESLACSFSLHNQLSSRDTVHEVLQFTMERPESCYRTALSVHHKGKRLDDFFEIGSIEGLEDGDTIEVLEGRGGV